MKKKNKEKIDFVIIWVDGNDPEWQKEKAKYSPNKNTDSRNIRYRDWDNLKYWFRGVEKFAPWVNKVYFVTCGHYPEWLNKENPKLVCVKHSDYMPKEYLPTFSSIPIELNIHRIKELSEQFVYFNDDMFITNNVEEEDFFKNGKPVDMAVLNPVTADDKIYSFNLYNDISIINQHFNKKELLKNNLSNFLNIRYGKYNIRTLLCLPWNKILGFFEPHHCNSYLKSTFKTVWEKEYNILNESSMHKFRNPDDVNQYIFKYWQYCTNAFSPKKNQKKLITTKSTTDTICKIIEQKNKFLCINDVASTSDEFEIQKNAVIKSFEKILPEKSSFEK